MKTSLPKSLRGDNYAIIAQGNHAHIYPGELQKVSTLEELKSLQKSGNVVTFLTPSNTMREAGREAVGNESIIAIVSDPKKIQYMTRDRLARTLSMHGDDRFTLGDFSPSMSDADYANRVREVQQHIADGDICQAVLARSFTAPIAGLDPTRTPLAILARLLQIRGTAMQALFHTKDHSYAFASPERHLTIRNGRATINPIAGTMRIGDPETFTARLESFLMHDEKEREELTMLLDEGTKMIARFCPHGHIEGPFLRETGAVIHTEYLISGKIVPYTHVIDALRRTLNAPTLIGSPINRASEILARIEQITRGYYGGVFGVYRNSGNLDTAIAIRGVHINHGRETISITAGAGITQRSVPQSEADETRNKAQGNIVALSRPASHEHRFQLSPPEKRRFEKSIQQQRNTHLSRFHLGEQQDLEPCPELIGKKVTIINFDDDFAYILSVMMESLGCEAEVVHHSEYMESKEDILVFSGGPGDINDMTDAKMNRLREIMKSRGEKPLLGICLGCQAICQELGIPVMKLPKPLQGIQTDVLIDADGKSEKVGQYNSFAGNGLKKDCDIFMKPDCSIDMIHDPVNRMLGVQFHPESVMTQNGREIVKKLLLKLIG